MPPVSPSVFRRCAGGAFRPGTRALVLLCSLTIALGLVADQWGGPWAPALVSLWVWGCLPLLFRHSPHEARGLLACLCIATLGEGVLSLVWGLYDYREGTIPLFVPPGHVMLYWLGLQLAPRLPGGLHRAIVFLALIGVTGFALAGKDGLGPALLLIFLACVRWGPTPRLYTSMFLLSLLMELWGTWLGNWRWAAQVPGLGWPLANPPLAAGAFYCVLDLLAGLVRRPQAQPA